MKAEKHEEKRITPRSEDFSQWYQDIVEIAELAEHSPVRGSMTIKPYGYAIWENIRTVLDKMFKETGVVNAYFPLLIPEKFLKKEAEHVEGFSPQVAVVTHAGGKKLDEPLVIRPTSETIIYEAYSRWVESYRDLPILINQWANVLRWELRPRLFLRTTEFLWQEGHTVHRTEQEAEERTKKMLSVYKDFSENYLGIPVIEGLKTESEKFAGALRTYSIEAMMQDGKALQMGTSHNLGQNFSKPFDIKFLDEDNELKYCWQTSWGVSTRTIGALIMAHSDDKGLVLPPKIAPTKVVLIPILNNKDDDKVMSVAEDIANKLGLGLNTEVKVDRKKIRFGEKHYYWEKRGVPIRIEIGPREIENNIVIATRRDTGEKVEISQSDLLDKIRDMLDDIQNNIFQKALKYKEENIVRVNSWDEFKKEIENGKFVLAHWSGESQVEKKINDETGATIRCIPVDIKKEEGKCIYSGKDSQGLVIFAKSY